MVLLVLIQFSSLIEKWMEQNFSKLNLINSLYVLNINELFSNRQPIQSLVLERGPISELYKHLSRQPASIIQPLKKNEIIPPKREKFKFMNIIDEIVVLFKEQCQSIYE